MTPPEVGAWVDWQDKPDHPDGCACWDYHDEAVDQYRRPKLLPYGTWRYVGPEGCPVHPP